jgi:methionyl-tRNA formyltransferase
VRIVFLTTADPLYLPGFFERVFDRRAADVAAVYVVPPLYRDQSHRSALSRYARTFGLRATAHLATEVMTAKARRRSIESVCRRQGVAVAAAADVNADEFLAQLRALAPDVIVSVSCPQIFRAPLIGLPSSGVLNVHGALLPEYRGILPSFWMLANGETRAGVSVYFVDERIDAGEVCAQRAFEISPDDTLDSFLRRSKLIAADLLLEVLDAIDGGTCERRPLDLSQGSYYSWPDAEAVKRFRERGRALW